MIRLGQLLKLAGIADTGADTKALLADAAVTVNGEPEGRRGRQLHPGDVVTVVRAATVPGAAQPRREIVTRVA